MSSQLPFAHLANKKELASILDCSLPTLTSWIDRYGEEFPVEQRGTNGKEWLFAPAAVIAFLKAKRDEEAAAEAERAKALKQFQLPILAAEEDEPAGIKASDLLAMAKVRQMQRREALENSLLVPTSDVRMALTTAFAKLARFQAAMLTQLARKHGWSDAQLRDARALMAEGQRAFVRDAADFAPDEPEDDAHLALG